MGLWNAVKRWWRAVAGSTEPGGPTVISSFGYGSVPPRKGTLELFRAFRDSPWLQAVENRLAHERATALRLRLYDGPEDDDERAPIRRGDPRAKVLEVLRRPTVASTGQVISARQRDKLLALWYGLCGEAFLIKQRNAIGQVVGLVPISPLWVVSTPTVREPWYLCRADADPARPFRAVPTQDVIPIVDLDPENPYGRGFGAGRSLGDELDTDEGAAKLMRAELFNMGSPSGVVVIEGATATELDKIRGQWRERFGGPDRAGQVEFAKGKAQFIPMSREKIFADAIDARKFLRDTFIQVHGISPEIFGVLNGSTRDSAWVAYYHLALGCLVPWCEIVIDAYQAHLVPDFGASDVWLDYVSPVPEDRDLRLRSISVAPSAFRGRDVRQIGDFAPDAELDEKVLGNEPQRAQQTNLPSTPGPSARALVAREPAWALAREH